MSVTTSDDPGVTKHNSHRRNCGRETSFRRTHTLSLSLAQGTSSGRHRGGIVGLSTKTPLRSVVFRTTSVRKIKATVLTVHDCAYLLYVISSKRFTAVDRLWTTKNRTQIVKTVMQTTISDFPCSSSSS